MIITEEQKKVLLNCTSIIMCEDRARRKNTATSIWFKTKDEKHLLLTNAHVIDGKSTAFIYCRMIVGPKRENDFGEIRVPLNGVCKINRKHDLGVIFLDDTINMLHHNKMDPDVSYIRESFLSGIRML